MLPAFLSGITLLIISFYMSYKNWSLRDEIFPIIITILAIITVLSWITIPFSVSSIKSEIESYNNNKFIIQHMNFKEISELRKAQFLESFLVRDRKMRYYKAHYDSFWFDLYIPDKECKAIELIKGW